MMKPVTIVGGGLAGLTLGIGLRQRDVPVTLWEAGAYPRHRVCGEFISGRGQQSLQRLGLLELLQSAPTTHAKDAAFYLGAAGSRPSRLPEPALCISRFYLDELLAGEFQRLGGELRVHERSRETAGSGIVRATGRRPETAEGGWRWFGLKVHARDVELTADLEMHFVPNGYVGLCRLAGGEVNICGLFRSRKPMPDLAQTWRNRLCGPDGSVLQGRLANVEFDEASFCSVAGLGLHKRRASDREECAIGDSLTMIPPVTGNGMSMAFESAELAIEPLAEFSKNGISWEQAQKRIAAACDARFARRLSWAGMLQRALFIPWLRPVLFQAVSHADIAWRSLFERTR